METSKKKPAAGVPAAKEPAPSLASGKYTFSKAEALRRYLTKKKQVSKKGVSKVKREEVCYTIINCKLLIPPSTYYFFVQSIEEEKSPLPWETIQQRYSCCEPEEAT